MDIHIKNIIKIINEEIDILNNQALERYITFFYLLLDLITQFDRKEIYLAFITYKIEYQIIISDISEVNRVKFSKEYTSLCEL